MRSIIFIFLTISTIFANAVPKIMVDGQQLLKSLAYDEQADAPNLYDWRLIGGMPGMIAWDPEGNKWSESGYERKGNIVLSNGGKITHHTVGDAVGFGYWKLQLFAKKSQITFASISPNTVTQENPNIQVNIVNIVEKVVCKEINSSAKIGYRIKYPGKKAFWMVEETTTSSKGKMSAYNITFDAKPKCVIQKERDDAEAKRLEEQKRIEEAKIAQKKKELELLRKQKEAEKTLHDDAKKGPIPKDKTITDSSPQEYPYPETQKSANRQNLSTFLHAYIDAGNSSYSPNIAAQYYASFVHPYFNIRNASRRDILRDKQKYYRKWPERNYKLTKYTVVDRYQRAGLSYLEVILEIDWRVASHKRGERTGHSVVTMTLVADGGSYKITAVRNAHIQRDIPVKASSMRYSPDGAESAETYAPIYFSSNGIEGKLECKRVESYKTCTVTATNHVGTGKGGISISFPNIYYRSSDVTVDSSRGFDTTNFYSSGSMLWSTQYGRKISSSYLLLEGWAKRWRQGATKRIQFSLGGRTTPVQVRAVVVRHRREYIAPANYSTTDQQGYPVAVWHHR